MLDDDGAYSIPSISAVGAVSTVSTVSARRSWVVAAAQCDACTVQVE